MKTVAMSPTGRAGFRDWLLNKRVTLFNAAAFVLLVFAFSQSLFGGDMPWWLPYALIIALFFLTLIVHGKEMARSSRAPGLYMAFIKVLPYAVFAAITVFQIAAGTAGFYQPTRCLSSVLQLTIIALIPFVLFTIYGRTAADALFWILTFVYAVSAIHGFIVLDASTLISYFMQETVPTSSRLHFELHDVGLTMPMFAVWYLLVDREANHRGAKVFIAVLISLMAFKRIALAAAVVAIVVGLFMGDKVSDKPSVKERVVQIGLFVAPILWLLVCTSNELTQLASEYGIELSGRGVIYQYFEPYVSFDLTSLGQGYGFTSRLLQGMTNSKVLTGVYGVQAIHNDFLKYLIEAGFPLFLLGLFYFVFVFPRLIGAHYGSRSRRVCILVLTYMFVTYMTDNTSAYTVFQSTMLLLVLSEASYWASSPGKDMGSLYGR